MLLQKYFEIQENPLEFQVSTPVLARDCRITMTLRLTYIYMQEEYCMEEPVDHILQLTT